jgi:hypothetical protein
MGVKKEKGRKSEIKIKRKNKMETENVAPGKNDS